MVSVAAIFEHRASIGGYGAGRSIAANDPDLLAVAAPGPLKVEADGVRNTSVGVLGG